METSMQASPSVAFCSSAFFTNSHLYLIIYDWSFMNDANFKPSFYFSQLFHPYSVHPIVCLVNYFSSEFCMWGFTYLGSWAPLTCGPHDLLLAVTSLWRELWHAPEEFKQRLPSFSSLCSALCEYCKIFLFIMSTSSITCILDCFRELHVIP